MIELLRTHWPLFLIIIWIFFYGFKFETAGFKIYINGLFKTYYFLEDMIVEHSNNEEPNGSDRK